MDWLAWGASDGANGERLWEGFRIAVVAFRKAFFDDLHLPVETRCPAFDQRYIRGQAHFVHMSSRVKVIESVEDKVKGLKPFDIEANIFDVCMVCFELDIGVEFAGSVLCDLETVLTQALLDGGDQETSDQCFWLLYMFISEEELSIEIAQVDGVEIDDVNFAEAGQDEILQ